MDSFESFYGSQENSWLALVQVPALARGDTLTEASFDLNATLGKGSFTAEQELSEIETLSGSALESNLTLFPNLPKLAATQEQEEIHNDSLTRLATAGSLVGESGQSNLMGATTNLKFVQDKLNLKVLENGVLVETVKGKQSQPIPDAFQRLTISAIDSPDIKVLVDKTCLDRSEGIGVTDGDDGNSGLKKRIDGDEALEITIEPTQLYNSATMATVGIDKVASISSEIKGGKIKLTALKGGTVVGEMSYTITKKNAQLTFTSDTPFDSLRISAGNGNTQFTFRSVEFKAVKSGVAPQLNASLAHDTGISNTDGITSDPTVTGSINSSSAIASGIAYVADGTGGLQIINYLPFDNRGVAPTVSISSSIADADPNTSGILVVEGSAVPIKVTINDDVQVRNVELLVNGQVVTNDVSTPFDFFANVPILASGATSAA
ncbi:MAG: Ig-like domain-containing protein, partial [Microcystaceae cyanobacterium]